MLIDSFPWPRCASSRTYDNIRPRITFVKINYMIIIYLFMPIKMSSIRADLAGTKRRIDQAQRPAEGFDITVAKELLGHQDIITTMVYAKADVGLLRDSIRSLDDLSKNGHKSRRRECQTAGGKSGYRKR